MQNGVAVIGSASGDDIYFVPHFPKDHETLHATKFVQALGGKGIYYKKKSRCKPVRTG